jgi:alpha-methylacyl-CoA racemase
MSRDKWPELRAKMDAIFATKTREEWTKILEGSDACAAPVVSLSEAPNHPHLAARKTFVDYEGGVQPAPAPRFSRTVSAIQHSAAVSPVSATDVLSRWSSKTATRASA